MIRSNNVSVSTTEWIPLRENLDAWEWFWINPGNNLYVTGDPDSISNYFLEGMPVLFGRVSGPFLLPPGSQLYGRRPSGTSDVKVLTVTAGPKRHIVIADIVADPGPA